MSHRSAIVDGELIHDGQPTGLSIVGWEEVWRIGPDGAAHRVWERIMPRIDDSALECSIFLYPSETDAEKGESVGGSGFLVGLKYEHSEATHLYAVTNSHVAKECPVIRLNSKKGEPRIIPRAPSAWVHHSDGDDLAISSIELDKDKYKFKYLLASPSFLMTEDRMKRSDIGAGDETFMVGRYVGRDERKGNVPVVRFGHLAAAGTETINQGKERDYFLQESFLVETHSIGGLSGSPVFVWVPFERVHRGPRDGERAMQWRKEVRSLSLKPREWLLGIDWGHLDEVIYGDDGEQRHILFPGMAGIVPAWKLSQMLAAPEIVEMRQKKERNDKTTSKLDMRQRRSQKSHAGADIPVPAKADFERDLSKAIRKTPSEN
jgi:hypothetical protein